MSTEPSWEALVQIIDRRKHHEYVRDGFTAPNLEKAAKAVLAEGYHLGHEHNEFGVFRKNWPDGLGPRVPMENKYFGSREIAEKWLKGTFIITEAYEVLGRYVTDWR